MKGYHHDRPSCNRQHADLYPPPTHVFGLPPPLLCPGASRDLAKEAAERGTHVQYLETLIEGEAYQREDRRTQRDQKISQTPRVDLGRIGLSSHRQERRRPALPSHQRTL
jgi:hypothetical protein